MPIDYSKWDKIELSDDSDVEVHPNVDKKSFIKWKQRDIHEKRAQRNQEIKTYTIQTDMYTNLNKRVDYLLGNLTDEELVQEKVRNAKLNQKFDPKEKFDPSQLDSDITVDVRELEDNSPYNDMIDDLFTQVTQDMIKAKQDPRNPEILKQLIKEHRAKIDKVLAEQAIRLKDLKEEKKLHISSEDMRTGFDMSFTNKEAAPVIPPQPSKSATKASAAPTTTTTTTTTTANSGTKIETINSPIIDSNLVNSSAAASSALSAPTSSTIASNAHNETDESDEFQLSSDAETFGRISPNDLILSAKFLDQHAYIVTENQKDALIMTAFDAQLAGDSARAKNIVHQSLLLQYCAQLANVKGPITKNLYYQVQKSTKLFFSKIVDSKSQAAVAFKQDVEFTFNHIKTRCALIQKENETEDREGEEQIQLRSLDPNSELVITLPDPESTDEEEINRQKEFLTLPVEMQNALKTGSLDEINKVFSTLSVGAAENILEIFERAQVIGIEELLEDENEFQELQKKYTEENKPQTKIENKLGELEIDKNFISTADIVD